MEYIAMSGQVILKQDYDVNVVTGILEGLHNIEFADRGHVYTAKKSNILKVECEGTIDDINSIKTLLVDLKRQLTDTSMIAITRGKWDTLIKLSYFTPSAKMVMLSKAG